MVVSGVCRCGGPVAKVLCTWGVVVVGGVLSGERLLDLHHQR